MVLIALCAGTSLGATYYVSPGGNDLHAGTVAQPWKTIRMAGGTLIGGDTVYIRSGTYNEQLIPVNSGSAGNPITFSS